MATLEEAQAELRMREILKAAQAELDRRKNVKPERPADQGILHRIADNVIGLDDGYTSFGENLGSFGNAAIESGTLGIVGDEAAAWADSLGGGDYDAALARRRETEATFREDHPVAAFGADLSGAFVPGLGIAGAAARGTGLMTGALKGATAGVGAGALQGAAEGEGGLIDRGQGAMVGGAVGGALGAAASPVSRGAGFLWDRLGGGASKALREAEDKVGLDRAGLEIVSEAVERDRPYADEALRMAGPGAINAEMGKNAQGLLDFVVNRPGRASARTSNAVQEYGAKGGQDLRRAMDETLGAENGVARTQREIMQGSRNDRETAYNAAYAKPIDYSGQAGGRVLELMDRVDGAAIRAANKLMKAEGNSSRQIRATIDDDGNVSFDTLPDVRQLDYITRALRDMDNPLAGTGKDAGSAFKTLAREIRTTLDDIVPEYKAARAEGRDAIANREAVEFGESLLSRNTKMDEAEDTLAAMTDGEKRFVRQGLRDHFAEIMENAQLALTDRNMDAREALRPVKEALSGAGKRKLRALLGDQADAFIRQAEESYSKLSLRASVNENSKTQPRRAAEEVIDRAVPPGALEALGEGRGLLGAATAVARPLLDDPRMARLARRDDVVDRIGQFLMQPVGNAAETLPMMRQIPGLLQAAQQTSGRVAGGVNTGMGILSALAAQQASQAVR